jgi:hypothetical protein
VEGAACQRRQSLRDEGLLAVHEPGDLGAVDLGAARHRRDVGLVVLADVGGVGAGDGARLAHPRDGDGGVEAAGECDADALADGKRSQNLGHGRQPSRPAAESRTGNRAE